MKKQLNLICVLIFFFVGLSLVPSIYSMGNAFVDGFKEGMSQAEEAHEQGTTNISAGILSPMTLSLWPKSLAATSDKLFNQKDQEWYPATYQDIGLGEIQRCWNCKICKFPYADRSVLYYKSDHPIL